MLSLKALSRMVMVPLVLLLYAYPLTVNTPTAVKARDGDTLTATGATELPITPYDKFRFVFNTFPSLLIESICYTK